MAALSGATTPVPSSWTRATTTSTRGRLTPFFKAHPNIDKVCFGYVGDVSLFLDTTTDFDMHVVGVDEDGEMLYVREEWDCTWRFGGLYVTRYSCRLVWYAKHGDEILTVNLGRLGEQS